MQKTMEKNIRPLILNNGFSYQRTIPRLFEESVKKYKDRPYLWEKHNGKYQSISFGDSRNLVYSIAAGLMAAGIKKGDRCAILSEGRVDWIITELGILYAGAISVPFSVKLERHEELKFRLLHSECRFCFVSGTQAQKVIKLKHDLPDLEKIILFDTEPKDPDEISFKTLHELGRQYLGESERDFNSCWQSIQEKDLANICYTSGTITDPKGVILTHRNYTANVEQSCAIADIPPDWVTLLILPWDHSFGHTAGLYLFMAKGASIAAVECGQTSIETLRNIPINIKQIRPQLIYSVPALSKNFRKGIEQGICQKGPWAERFFRKALKVAYRYNSRGIDRGKGMRKVLKPLCGFFDIIFFRKIQENFGGRLQYFIGGGALIDPVLEQFFYAIGIPIYQGYGLTEASPIISANSPESHKLGTSGKILSNLELRILNDQGEDLPQGEAGEIIVKGENVMKGYWRNDKATKKAIRGGWLFTGDLGYVDEDGFLVVLGRKKSLLISDDGKKYSPEGIEEALINSSPYIEQLMLYNNQSPYTISLIYPNRENLLCYLKERGLSPKSEKAQHEVLSLIENEIAEFKTGRYKDIFPTKWLPAAIAVLGEGFTMQNRMLNSSMKIVRRRIFEFYEDRIEYLFTPEGKNIFNHRNRTIVSRLDEQTTK